MSESDIEGGESRARSNRADSSGDPLPVGPALIRMGTILQSIYDARAREQGLTSQQARLLFVVVEKPDNMLGLGSTVSLGRSTMTSLVDRMEALGLLSRSPDPDDRRRLLVSPTEQGIRISRAFERGMRESITALTDQLTQAERDSLARLVSLLLVEGDALLRSE